MRTTGLRCGAAGSECLYSQAVRHITRVWMVSMPTELMYCNPIPTAGMPR